MRHVTNVVVLLGFVGVVCSGCGAMHGAGVSMGLAEPLPDVKQWGEKYDRVLSETGYTREAFFRKHPLESLPPDMPPEMRVQVVKLYVSGTDMDKRSAVAVALGDIGQASATPYLLMMFLNEPARNRQALGTQTAPGGDGTVWRRTYYRDRGPGPAYYAGEAICRIGRPALPYLLNAVKELNLEQMAPVYRLVTTIDGNGESGGAETLRLLRAQLHHPDWLVRAKATRFLSLMPGDQATDLLLEASNDPDPVLRVNALQSMCSRNDPRVEAAIVKAQHDPDSVVRDCADAIRRQRGP